MSTYSTYSTLFAKWQQRCGLSLPVLQQFVVNSGPGAAIARVRVAVCTAKNNKLSEWATTTSVVATFSDEPG